jgi:esterase
MPDDLFVNSAGVRLAVRDYGGSGVPLVLVHGHYGNLAEFDMLGPALAKHARVVAYDQRGQGWSERGPIGIAEFADDLAAVTALLGLERPALFGSSFGTLVCLAYVRHGGAARAFISQDGRASDFGDLTPRSAPSHPRRVLSSSEWQAYVTGFSAIGPEGTAAALRSGVRLGADTYEVRPRPEDLFRKEQAFARLEVTDAYRAVAGPVVMLAAERGSSDRAEREQELATLTELVGAEVKWFATGHAISAEDLEGVTAAVEDVLSRTDRA